MSSIIFRRRGFLAIASSRFEALKRFGLSKHKLCSKSFKIDTLETAKRLEADGMPIKQAEITASVFADHVNKLDQSFASKQFLLNIQLALEAKLTLAISEVKFLNEKQFEALELNIERMRNNFNIKFIEIDKSTQGQTHAMKVQAERIKVDAVKYFAFTLFSSTGICLALAIFWK